MSAVGLIVGSDSSSVVEVVAKIGFDYAVVADEVSAVGSVMAGNIAIAVVPPAIRKMNAFNERHFQTLTTFSSASAASSSSSSCSFTSCRCSRCQSLFPPPPLGGSPPPPAAWPPE